MEVMGKPTVALCCVVVVIWAWKLFNWLWLTPKRLEKRLREQGFQGNPYRILVGDLKETQRMIKEAWSKPLPLGHSIVPRLVPHADLTVKTYGKKSFSWAGTMPRVNIMDPELIRTVMNNYGAFQKHFPAFDPLTRFILTGLGSLEGDTWSRHRRIIAPSFNLDKLKIMIPAFYLTWSKLMNDWEKNVSEKGSHEADVFPLFDSFTADVIARTAFGTSYEEGRKIFENLKEMIDLTVQLMKSVNIPGRSYLPTKLNTRIKTLEKEIQTGITNVINNRAKAMKAGEEASEADFLGILLENNRQEIQRHGNNKSAGLNIEEIIEECKAFFFLGQETTSILLTWTMVLLGKYSKWQERAREEVFQTIGKNKPDFDSINNLKILPMIFYEVLRLYPPAYDLNRIPQEEVKLGEVTLPRGVMINLPSILLHYDHEIWGDDAHEFNPERFSQGISNAVTNKAAYLPFGFGPRVCPGQSFALVQAKMVLAMILQRFYFEVSPSYTHAPYAILTLQPQYGAQIVFRAI